MIPLLAASFVAIPPAAVEPDLRESIVETGTLPTQVFGVAVEPHDMYILAPGWSEPGFQARCRTLYPASSCDPAGFRYPTREQVAGLVDVAHTYLRYTVLLQPGAPLTARIEGFDNQVASRTHRFTVTYDPNDGSIDASMLREWTPRR